MKSDYLKFIEIAKVELPSNLKIQTHETDKGYYFTYGKIRDLDSILYEDGKSDRYFKYKGIYVDIFLWSIRPLHFQNFPHIGIGEPC